MIEAGDPRLSAWQSYYVIVGSSGAALIGIQFVVITLIASLRKPVPADTVGAFGTPAVVHLTGALFVSAVLCAPWHSLLPASVVLAMCGFGGLAYGVVVIHCARRQTAYQPVWEDWLWHAVLPCTLYAALAVSALLLRTITHASLYAIGASALGLLLVGIHNAWDTVTHLVVTGSGTDETARR